MSGAFCVEAGRVPAQTHEDCGGSSGHGSAPGGALNTTLRAGSPWWSSGGTTRIKRATPAGRPTHNLAGTVPRNGSDDTVPWPMGHVVTGVRTSGVAGMQGPWSPRTDGQPPADDRPEERRAPTQKTGGHQPKDWQALPSNTVGDDEFFLAFGKCVSEVVRGSFILVWGLGMPVIARRWLVVSRQLVFSRHPRKGRAGNPNCHVFFQLSVLSGAWRQRPEPHEGHGHKMLFLHSTSPYFSVVEW